MQVFVNRKEVTIQNAPENLEEILADVSSAFEDDKRAIRRVVVNGERYDEAIPHDARNMPVEMIRTVEIELMDRQEIIRSFLEDSDGIFENIKKSAVEIARLLRKDNEQEALKHYGRFLDSLSGLYRMVYESERFLQDDAENAVSDGTLENFEKLLDSLAAAQKNRDWVMLADLLEFETAPLTDDWQKVLVDVKKEIKD